MKRLQGHSLITSTRSISGFPWLLLPTWHQASQSTSVPGFELSISCSEKHMLAAMHSLDIVTMKHDRTLLKACLSLFRDKRKVTPSIFADSK
jgi:hypothetical protein